MDPLIQCGEIQSLHTAAGKAKAGYLGSIPLSTAQYLVHDLHQIPDTHSYDSLAQRLCHMSQMEAGGSQK